jgi:hypothetical protein
VSISIPQRGCSARCCGIKPSASQCYRREVNTPVGKIFINVTQDIRALHCRTKCACCTICLLLVARANAEQRRHQSTDGAGNLVAVKIKIGVTRDCRPSKVIAHTIKKGADRIGGKLWGATLKVNEDC